MAALILLEGGGRLLAEGFGRVITEIQPTRVAANGRWRSIIDPATRFGVADQNTLLPYVGEVGFSLFFNTTIALSPLIDKMMETFTAPSGRQLAVSGDLFFVGIDPVAGNLLPRHSFIAYTFGVGDLAEAGVWTVQMSLYGSPTSGIGQFRVTPP